MNIKKLITDFGIFITITIIVLFSANACTVPNESASFRADGDDVTIDTNYAKCETFFTGGYSIKIFDIHYRGHDYLYMDGRLYHAPHCGCNNNDASTTTPVNTTSETVDFNFNL